ncbi:hypothetical protein VTK73DRAFT_6735 [Phialemonium thermophilum]|uniref:Uncharacterized protein n=1 Tax=Phialemonium thermophilum TaxID=223376 RepID=A0ABR3WIE9_9PEZI
MPIGKQKWQVSRAGKISHIPRAAWHPPCVAPPPSVLSVVSASYPETNNSLCSPDLMFLARKALPLGYWATFSVLCCIVAAPFRWPGGSFDRGSLGTGLALTSIEARKTKKQFPAGTNSSWRSQVRHAVPIPAALADGMTRGRRECTSIPA